MTRIISSDVLKVIWEDPNFKAAVRSALVETDTLFSKIREEHGENGHEYTGVLSIRYPSTKPDKST